MAITDKRKDLRATVAKAVMRALAFNPHRHDNEYDATALIEGVTEAVLSRAAMAWTLGYHSPAGTTASDNPFIEGADDSALDWHREAIASAWDDGAEAGEQSGLMPSMYGAPVNPYRAAGN